MPTADQIVHTTVTRTSAVASLPGFGVPAVFAQFAAGTKGFAASGLGSRAKFYSTRAALLADGWLATDSVYLWAASAFLQSPTVDKIMVGRIDSGDASVAASGDAIRADQDDFYGIEVVGNRSLKFSLSTALTTGNIVASSINGVAVANVTYATSHAATMAAWKAAIETAVPGSTATVSGNDMTVVLVGKNMDAATFSVSGGTAVTATISYILDATKTKAWMAWAEGVKKILFVQDSDVATYAASTGVAGTACLAEFAKLMNYERTACVFHANPAEYVAAGWIAQNFVPAPGAGDWAFKTLKGISSDGLTPTQSDNITGKNCNVYQVIAGIQNTYAGSCAKGGRYIDDQRVIDKVDTQLKLDFLTLRNRLLKIPRDRFGYQAVAACLDGTMANEVKAGGVVAGSYTINMPKPSESAPADIASRTIKGITIQYTLTGSVNNLDIFVNVEG